MQMKYLAILICFTIVTSNSLAQYRVFDSVRQALTKTTDDSVRLRLLIQAGEFYAFINTDSSAMYTKKAIALAMNKKSALWEAYTNLPVALVFFVTGDIASALEATFKNINNYATYQDAQLYTYSTTFVGILYMNNGNYTEAMSYANKSLQLCDTVRPRNNLNNVHIISTVQSLMIEDYMVLAMAYLHFNKLDSALLYGKKAYDMDINYHLNNNYPLYRLALVYARIGYTHIALSLFKRAISLAYKQNLLKDIIDSYNGMSEVFKTIGQTDSAIYYAYKVMELSKVSNYKRGALDASQMIANMYEKQGNTDSAFHYYKFMMAAKDTLFNQEKVQQVQGIAFKEELREQENRRKILEQQTEYRNKIKINTILGSTFTFLFIILVLWRNNRQKRKANALLENKNVQIEITLKELNSTQAQLIQQEKMASLGELTAGIAHEIQNPLNFVNNFSEVNTELIEELKDEVDKGNLEEVKAIAKDIKDNEQKINHHGKRADAIVKGMLQHSQSSSGLKEPSDINKLGDEYLRLSYHGLRNKDKNFNATMKTEFDQTIGKINIVPQDIGRVLLNLYNNAFYAIAEKKKQQPEGYEPTVSVSTKKDGDKIFVSVKDNGKGIPQKIVDKIFQPFFTTKPTGQGTGLGLSLAYDIIKAHGGEIKVETKEGEGSEFIIQLPV